MLCILLLFNAHSLLLHFSNSDVDFLYKCGLDHPNPEMVAIPEPRKGFSNWNKSHFSLDKIQQKFL